MKHIIPAHLKQYINSKDLNEKELAEIDSRNDGEVEVIDVKLNNRKTKKVGDSKISKNQRF